MRTSAPPLTANELSAFANKRILITGAGGFLGSALARSLARMAAAHLTLLDIAEHGLYRLDQALRSIPRVDSSLVVGSVNDRALLRDLLRTARPDIVFHAAARKHVPLMESNALAAAETNVLGTQAVVRAAEEARTPTVLLLSTDKAVEPISVMGATKHVAEQIVLAARQRHTGQDFKAVRLCNVLGSTGSVAPLFARQIAAGGPITITDPQATRFFVTTRDAVRHLLRAAITPTSTGLLVPELRKAHRVDDLAHYMLARAPHAKQDVTPVYTGLRPADKLHELLLAPGEHVITDQTTRLGEVVSPVQAFELQATLSQIEQAVEERDLRLLMKSLEQAIPAYRTRPASLAAADKELA